MFRYPATLLQVIDGCTVLLRLDLGFHLYREATYRLHGIDAPELGRPEGEQAKQALESRLVGEQREFSVQTYKRDKLGRWLVDLFDEAGVNLNRWLVEEGHARAWR